MITGYLDTELHLIDYLPITCICNLSIISKYEYAIIRAAPLYQHIKDCMLSNYKISSIASAEGHVDVLEWCKNNGSMLEKYRYAMNDASEAGHIDVLNWWKNSGLTFKYTTDAMHDASKEGHINVLEWWKNSGLPLKYNKRLRIIVSERRFDVLNWWKNSGLM